MKAHMTRYFSLRMLQKKMFPLVMAGLPILLMVLGWALILTLLKLKSFLIIHLLGIFNSRNVDLKILVAHVLQ